jgi:cytochrome P450
MANSWCVYSYSWKARGPSDLHHRAILHDPNVFDDPETFNPDRYMKDGALDPTVRDPGVAVFGYGRR